MTVSRQSRAFAREYQPMPFARGIALPAAFTVDGPRAASDAARIDAGARLAINPNAWVFASFDGEFSRRSQSYAGKAGAKMSW